MPIYDYVCESCGHVVEVIHGISAPGPAACERCGGPMKRALSAPAIVFKGSGWAKKDARDASRSRSATVKGGDTGGTPEAATAAAGSTEGAGGTDTGSTQDAPATTATPTTKTPPTSGSSSGSGAAPG